MFPFSLSWKDYSYVTCIFRSCRLSFFVLSDSLNHPYSKHLVHRTWQKENSCACALYLSISHHRLHPLWQRPSSRCSFSSFFTKISTCFSLIFRDEILIFSRWKRVNLSHPATSIMSLVKRYCRQYLFETEKKTRTAAFDKQHVPMNKPSQVRPVTSFLIHFRSDLVEFVPCSISRCLNNTFNDEVIRKFQTWRNRFHPVGRDTRVRYHYSVSDSFLRLIDQKPRRSSSSSFSVESYSCKMAGDPKKLYKQLRNEPGTSPRDLEILGPSQTRTPVYNYTVLNSPPPVNYSNPIARSISSDDESPLVKTIPRKTLIFLISTLNAAFEPDYEFSSCTSQDFSRETSLEVSHCFPPQSKVIESSV